MFQEVIRISLGRSVVNIAPRRCQGSCRIHYTHIPTPARIESIYDVKELKRVNNVSRFVLTKERGDKVRMVRCVRDRCGHIVVRGKTGEVALKLGRKTRNAAGFRICGI